MVGRRVPASIRLDGETAAAQLVGHPLVHLCCGREDADLGAHVMQELHQHARLGFEDQTDADADAIKKPRLAQFARKPRRDRHMCGGPIHQQGARQVGLFGQLTPDEVGAFTFARRHKTPCSQPQQ